MGSSQGRELVTQAEYARRKGVTRQSIGELVERGVLTLIDGKIDPVVADIQLADSMDPARSKVLRAAPTSPAAGRPDSSAGSPPMNAFLAAKIQREQYAAELARLDFEERSGKLLKRDDVERDAFYVARTLRDQLMALPRRVIYSIRSATTDRDAALLLEAEIRAVLGEFVKAADEKLRISVDADLHDDAAHARADHGA